MSNAEGSGVTYGAKRDEPASPAGEMSRMMRNRVGRPEMGDSRDVLIRGCSGANHRGDEEGLITRRDSAGVATQTYSNAQNS